MLTISPNNWGFCQCYWFLSTKKVPITEENIFTTPWIWKYEFDNHLDPLPYWLVFMILEGTLHATRLQTLIYNDDLITRYTSTIVSQNLCE